MIGVTRVDLRAPRVPADTPKARLHRLAARGSAFARQLGAHRVAEICDALTVALVAVDAAESRARTAETRLAAARQRNVELQQRNDQLRVQVAALVAELGAERFEEPTVTREPTLAERKVLGGGR